MRNRSRVVVAAQGWVTLVFACSSRAAFARRAIALVLPLGCLHLGCDDDALPRSRNNLIELPGVVVQTGFANGTVRSTVKVGGFGISKFPITNGEFSRCVKAGTCSTSKSESCAEGALSPHPGIEAPNYATEDPESPAVCVPVEQADKFCGWQGGRLPTLDEWLYAARGDTARRFAWGDAPAECKQHPLAPAVMARAARLASLEEDAGRGVCKSASRHPVLRVGEHESGASPSGVQDVLMVPGELLRGDASASFNACDERSGHCVVFGLQPGAIDSVEPFYSVAEASEGASSPPRMVVNHAYGFRCVVLSKEDT